MSSGHGRRKPVAELNSASPALRAGLKRDQSEAGRALSRLIQEILFTYFRLRAAADQMTARAGQTSGKWGMMRTLHEEGPRTVPQIARSRPVARQWVQRLANQLEADGLIEFRENPAHLRSKLMRLTAAGEQFVREMDREQAAWMTVLARGFDLSALRTAIRVVGALRDKVQIPRKVR